MTLAAGDSWLADLDFGGARRQENGMIATGIHHLPYRQATQANWRNAIYRAPLPGDNSMRYWHLGWPGTITPRSQPVDTVVP